MKKRMLSLMLVFALLFSIMPTTAFAEDGTAPLLKSGNENGENVALSENDHDLLLTKDNGIALTAEDYSYEDGVLTIKGRDSSYTLSMNEGVEITDDRVVVTSKGNVHLTINSINIDLSTHPGNPVFFPGNPAFLIDSNAENNVGLTLRGSNSLTGGYNCAALQKEESGTALIIDGSGSLVANGGEYAAGIGGGYYGSGSNIIINGGTVIAQGGSCAAGIGGGYYGSGSNIIINGGTVNATGSNYGAGIGGGQGGNGEDIRIFDGIVTAQGGHSSAGIGGGGIAGAGIIGSIGKNITISGGTVTATGGQFGAGIGGGLGDNRGGHGEDITISGGTVTATGGRSGAGIGGGGQGGGKNITISGGNVIAQGGQYSIAIGNGMSYIGENNTNIKIAPNVGFVFDVPEKSIFDCAVEKNISLWDDKTLTINFATLPAIPTISPNGGVIDHSLSVTLTGEEGVYITYTTNGLAPTKYSRVYKDAIVLTKDTTIKAIAIKNNRISPVATAEFTINPEHSLVHHEAKAATCTEAGWAAYDTCTRCDYTTYAKIEALGHDIVHHDAKAATCTEVGWAAYDTCTRCDYTTYAEIEALGHDIVHHDAKAATFTEVGWDAYDTCTRCDYTTYVEIPVLKHNSSSSYHYLTLSFNTNGGNSIASVRRIEGTRIDLASYTPTREGYDFTGWYSDATLTNKITSITLNSNKTVYASWKEENQQIGDWENPFIDVLENDWFYDDVRFAYVNDLMKGTASNNFSPNMTTNRGMIVTVLYRLAGEPTVSGACPFDDVKSGSYYEDAITWAAENEIVQGYGNNKFDPDGDITREQMAAILYRYASYNGYDVSGRNNLAAFSDVSQISSYALDNVKWAVDAGLISGMSNGTLAPQGNATRAQIAAILHRFINEFVQ